MARRVTSSQLKSYSSYSKTNNLSIIKPTNNSNTNIPINTNYETRLTQIEQTISNLQNSIHNINTSPTTNVDNKIRVFPEALSFSEHADLCATYDGAQIIMIMFFNQYPNDDILEHLYLLNPHTNNGIKVKNSKYEKYFIISNNNVKINGNIIQETELNIVAPDFFLVTWLDINLLHNETGTPYEQLVFTAKTGKKHTIIDNIDFDIDYNTSNVLYQIKITFPESVNIINNIPSENISAKQGSIITLKYDDKNLPLKDNNLDGEDSYTLVAQGSLKRYEIVFYWAKDTIPEFI